MSPSSNPQYTAQLFEGLVRAVNGQPNQRGEVYIPCPECGKEKRKFSFSEKEAHCFVCGFSASLKALAERLNAQPVADARPRLQEPQKPRQWQSNPQRFLDDYCAALDRVQQWQAYKPLSLGSISRWSLGVGRLPSSQCQHRRLVYPLLQGGKIVGFRGRSISCDCPKWLTCGGAQTVCVNLELVQRGSQVVICENPIDAMLCCQESDAIGIASTAGAGTWRDEWTQALAQARPEHVIVWLDNDLAGCPNLPTYNRLRAAWLHEHPGKRVPEPNGPRILARLRAAGIPSSLYQWANDAPAKYDIGSYLMESMEQAA